MPRAHLRFIVIMLLCAIFITGCSGNAPAASTPEISSTEEPLTPTVSVSTTRDSTTPDPCVSPQIEVEAQKVQNHMREFDDASTLASSVPQAQLSISIADLQRIRRAAEDEPVPACLATLKNYQISHMNSVINTLLAFMRSQDPLAIDCVDLQSNTEEEVVCQNIALARQQHDQYLVELARVLGVTLAPATPGAETPTP